MKINKTVAILIGVAVVLFVLNPSTDRVKSKVSMQFMNKTGMDMTDPSTVLGINLIGGMIDDKIEVYNVGVCGITVMRDKNNRSYMAAFSMLGGVFTFDGNISKIAYNGII